MINGEVPETDQSLMNHMVAIFERREKSYDKLLIQTALVKENDKWANVFTRLAPLSKEHTIEERTLAYENFIVASIKADASDFCPIVEQLITHGSLKIKGFPEVPCEGYFADKEGKYIPSDDDVFELGWPGNFYNFQVRDKLAQWYPRGPLVSVEKPFFPDGRAAIKSVIGVDLVEREHWARHILIHLPNYRAKIVGIRIGSEQSTMAVLLKEVTEKAVIGKLYCERGNETLTTDVVFSKERQEVHTGFPPHYLYFCLLHREDGELIDQREVSLWWVGRPLPKDVIIEMAGEDVRQLISMGETDKVEFKREVGKDRGLNEFVESAVAFANSSGGVILVGVDDNANIKGIDDENAPDRVTKILRSHCDPPIDPAMSMSTMDEGKVLVIRVAEGNNKPYMFRDKGIYVRAGATDRLITRAELDELYQRTTVARYA